MPGCGCRCLPHLFQQKEPPLRQRRKRDRRRGAKRGRPAEGVRRKGRVGVRAGRAGACEAEARTHAASVCTQCAPDRRLARSPPAHASLFSKSAAQPPAAETRAERTVCGSAGAGDPAPRPTRRASAGTHPPQRLSPPATPRSSPTSRRHRSAGERGSNIPLLGHPLSRSLRQFVSGDAAGRRHLLESSSGVGSAAALRCHLGDTTLRQDP